MQKPESLRRLDIMSRRSESRTEQRARSSRSIVETDADSQLSQFDYLNFNEEIYYFGVIQLSPKRAYQALLKDPPPADYIRLSPIERTVYLYYYMLYGKYITPVITFHRIFNREFYKYTAAGDSDDIALYKICKHTHDEYKLQLLKHRKDAYNKSQERLFSDEHASPDSSGRQSICDNGSELSIDSSSKEPRFHRVPHLFMRFSVGGKMVFLDLESSVSTLRIEDAKNLFHANSRQIDAVESFKGPMILGKTPPQTALLFIQRQIERIRTSNIYQLNQQSNDANDCLLIWHLLDVLVRQQGRVTGPDLARLLVSGCSYSTFNAQSFGYEKTESEHPLKNEKRIVDSIAMDKFTHYLLGGHVDEAIESAIRDGLLFDALFLANRMYRNNPKKLSEIEMKLLQYRVPQHPVMTLLSVAGEMAVPLLANTTADDTNGWRAHIAIVLANLHLLQTPAAINTIYQLGLALARKEFNSAADFCFLAVNLLTGYDCFRAPVEAESDGHRKHIKLISASLPDVEYHSTHTRFGWSILDYQATEIFEYTQNMANQGQHLTPLSYSMEFQKCRLEYAQLLSEYGGFACNVMQYCTEIARSICGRINELDPEFIGKLCEMGERFRYIGNAVDTAWDMYISSGNTNDTNPTIRQNLNQPINNVVKEYVPSQPPVGTSDLIRGTAATPSNEQPQIQQQEMAASVEQLKIHQHEYETTPFIEQPQIHRHQQQQQETAPFIEQPQVHHQQQREATPFIEQSQDQEQQPPPPMMSFSSSMSAFSVPPPVDIVASESSFMVKNKTAKYPSQKPNTEDFTPTDDINIPTSNKDTRDNNGLFSGLKSRLVKYIPSGNTMNLPDDTNPTIRWDSSKGRYVGDGVEEEYVPPPPPIGMLSGTTDAATPSIEQSKTLQQQQTEPSAMMAFAMPSIPIPGSPGAVASNSSSTMGNKSDRLKQKRYKSEF